MELSMKTIAIVIIFVLIGAIGIIWIYATFQGADTTSVFFNVSRNITENSSAAAGVIGQSSVVN